MSDLSFIDHKQSPYLHKIWLTQEADAKSWSSLKHVQPKEGRKELAPREIKFRCRRLDTTIRERAGSSQVPREAQESERYPGLFFFVSFFSSFLFLIRDVVAKSLRAMEETRADRSLPWFKQKERQPHNQLGFLWVMGYSERLRLLVGHALIHKCTHDIEITTNIHLQTCASWRHVNQPETLPTY